MTLGTIDAQSWVDTAKSIPAWMSLSSDDLRGRGARERRSPQEGAVLEKINSLMYEKGP
jgi:hypothetical protein